MHARGTSGDVSVRFFAVYVGGFAVWLLYGLGIGDVPIIVVHAVGLLCGTVTLAVALRLRRPAAVAATPRAGGTSPQGGGRSAPRREVRRTPLLRGWVDKGEKTWHLQILCPKIQREDPAGRGAFPAPNSA